MYALTSKNIYCKSGFFSLLNITQALQVLI